MKHTYFTNPKTLWAGLLFFLMTYLNYQNAAAQFVGITGTGAGINYVSYGTITTDLNEIRPFANTTTSITVYQDIWISGFNGAVNLDQARLYYKTNSTTFGTVNDASWSVLNGIITAVTSSDNDRATFTFDLTALTALVGTDIMFYIRFTEAGTDYYGFSGTASPHTTAPSSQGQLYKIRFNSAQTYNAKRIDGNFADWQANELIQSNSSRDWYVTWDNDNIYVRLVNLGANTDRINVGIDTDPATLYDSDVSNFSGLNFRGYLTPEFVVQSTGITNLNVFPRSGTNWGGATNIYSASTLWRSGGDAELRIPRTNVGLTSTSSSFALYCWLSNSSDAPYTTFIADNPTSGRMRSAVVWGSSGTGAVVNTSFSVDHNSSETRTLSISSGFRNLYVSNNIASINSNTILTGNVHINTGATLQLTGTSGNDLTLGGNFTNNGTFNDGTRAVFLNSTGTQTIGGSTTTTFSFLKLQKAGGIVQLNSDINIDSQLTLNDGGNTADLDLNGKNIILQGTSSFIAEQLTGTTCVVKDNTATTDIGTQGGYIQATGRTVNTSSTQIAGLGVYLQTTSGSYTDLQVKRYHYTAGAGLGIRLIYNLSGGISTGSPTIIGFRNPVAEENPNGFSLASITRIFRWSSGWSQIGASGSCGGLGDLCTSGTQTTFSGWTVGSENSSLPITLLNFKGFSLSNNLAELHWQTLFEKDNLGFDIEKSLNGQSFSKIAFVQGVGNSSTTQNYRFIDDAFGQSAYYRLKQLDIDGQHHSYSDIVFINKHTELGKAYIYPNPVAESINIGGLVANQTTNLTLLNAQGQMMGKFSGSPDEINEQLNAYLPKIAKGLYMLQIWQGGNLQTEKLIKQ